MESILSTNTLASVGTSVQTNFCSGELTRSIVIISDWSKKLVLTNSWPNSRNTKEWSKRLHLTSLLKANGRLWTEAEKRYTEAILTNFQPPLIKWCNECYFFARNKHTSKHCFTPGQPVLTSSHALANILVSRKTVLTTALWPLNNIDNPTPPTQSSKVICAINITLQHIITLQQRKWI